MKKLAIYSIFTAWFALTACSDFLQVDPVGAVTEDDLLNQEGIEMVITGMYSSLYSSSSDTHYFSSTLSNYAYGDVMGGSANKGSTYTDQSAFTNLETYVVTADNSYLNEKWQRLYEGVYRSNVVISMADKIQEELAALSGESGNYYTETIAQARFFRGFWHFEGVKLFGAAIPYVGTEEYLSSVNPQVSNVDASGNYIYIWDNIIEDLQYAYDNLPDTWGSEQGRVNKWAAGAMLAKVKMYQSSPYNGTNGTTNRWSEVKSLLEEIIASGKDNKGTGYRLADTYEELFVAGESDWTGESIFDIHHTISGTQENTNCINGTYHIGMSGALGTSGWGFYQPSYDLVNSYIVDDQGLPLIDGSYQAMDPLTTEDANGFPVTDLEVYTDPRLDITVGRFQVPYWDWSIPSTTDGWIRDVTNGGYYMNKKTIPKKADKGSLSVSTITCSSAKNFHLIRYADLLLWYAEALIETGDYQEARNYINQVRARAAGSYIQAADPETMDPATSPYIMEDLVNGTTGVNAAGNYRVGLYPASLFNSYESAHAVLSFERKVELAMEGHRWYDLARWGIIYDEITNYINYEQQFLTKYNGKAYGRNWVTLPIPYDQIITMEGVLVQNENWK
ncbi:MAG: RagB/SusD family nutrient uptake outer membrane protein [Tannerellaceae bacterium]|nr:RagB/SusD family nutrient uptake outer membrane protein [Tannerellaceae bacterium]